MLDAERLQSTRDAQQQKQKPLANKSEVTNEAVSAAAQYLLQENKSMVFQYQGKKYKLCVVTVDKEATDGTIS